MVINMSKLRARIDSSNIENAIQDITDYFSKRSLENIPRNIIDMLNAVRLHLRSDLPVVTETRVATSASNFVVRFGVIREIEVLASAVRASEV